MGVLKAVIFCFCICLLAVGTGHTNLTVTLYRVKGTRVEIEWQAPDAASDAIASCELTYGPVDQPDIVQVSAHAILDSQKMFELRELQYNVSYHFRVICNNEQENKYVSNTLIFTTDTLSKSDTGLLSSHSQKGNVNIMSGLRPFPMSTETDNRIPSSNVILGAACGIVGFIIINITVVIIVRRYSYWRMRQRRMFAIQEYDGFPHI